MYILAIKNYKQLWVHMRDARVPSRPVQCILNISTRGTIMYINNMFSSMTSFPCQRSTAVLKEQQFESCLASSHLKSDAWIKTHLIKCTGQAFAFVFTHKLESLRNQLRTCMWNASSLDFTAEILSVLPRFYSWTYH